MPKGIEMRRCADTEGSSVRPQQVGLRRIEHLLTKKRAVRSAEARADHDAALVPRAASSRTSSGHRRGRCRSPQGPALRRCDIGGDRHPEFGQMRIGRRPANLEGQRVVGDDIATESADHWRRSVRPISAAAEPQGFVSTLLL
jgi:hypothetical protein